MKPPSSSNKLIILSIFCTLSFIAFANDPFEKFAIVRVNVLETNDVLNVEIKEIKILDGHLKEIVEDELSGQKGDLLFQIVNENQILLKELIIKSPTRLRLEYPNADNSVGSIVTTIPEKEILIRFPYIQEMKYLILSRYNNGKPEIIQTVPLKEK